MLGLLLGGGLGAAEHADRGLLGAPCSLRALRVLPSRPLSSGAQKKWWMELKAVLYSWLRTGVEPL